MDKTSKSYNKLLKLNHVMTAVYLPMLLLMLSYTKTLYNIGSIKMLPILACLALCEILKFGVYYLQPGINTKKVKFNNIFKSIVTLLASVIIYYIVAVLFGAAFTTNQEETLMFALLMTILTVLPICLHFGPDMVFVIFTSLLSTEGTEVYKKFLINTQITVFGAWLGAVVIPLDWDKPYQEWPIPCCIGAILGNALSHLLLLLIPIEKYGKKTGKFSL